MGERAPEQREKPNEAWEYPYVAGVVDFGSSLSVNIEKASDTSVGYRIAPRLYISNTNKTALGFLDVFCRRHGIYPLIRETDTSYRLEISKRDDLRDFLSLVRPYIIVREEPVSILLNHLIPGLEDRKQSDKGGFIELMGYADLIKESTRAPSDRKYTKQYFQEKWDRLY
jgi:hypothetical protein